MTVTMTKTVTEENTDLTGEIHTLTTHVAKNAALVVDVHRHARLLVGGLPPDTALRPAAS